MKLLGPTQNTPKTFLDKYHSVLTKKNKIFLMKVMKIMINIIMTIIVTIMVMIITMII